MTNSIGNNSLPIQQLPNPNINRPMQINISAIDPDNTQAINAAKKKNIDESDFGVIEKLMTDNGKTTKDIKEIKCEILREETTSYHPIGHSDPNKLLLKYVVKYTVVTKDDSEYVVKDKGGHERRELFSTMCEPGMEGEKQAEELLEAHVNCLRFVLIDNDQHDDELLGTSLADREEIRNQMKEMLKTYGGFVLFPLKPHTPENEYGQKSNEIGSKLIYTKIKTGNDEFRYKVKTAWNDKGKKIDLLEDEIKNSVEEKTKNPTTKNDFRAFLKELQTNVKPLPECNYLTGHNGNVGSSDRAKYSVLKNFPFDPKTSDSDLKKIIEMNASIAFETANDPLKKYSTFLESEMKTEIDEFQILSKKFNEDPHFFEEVAYVNANEQTGILGLFNRSSKSELVKLKDELDLLENKLLKSNNLNPTERAQTEDSIKYKQMELEEKSTAFLKTYKYTIENLALMAQILESLNTKLAHVKAIDSSGQPSSLQGQLEESITNLNGEYEKNLSKLEKALGLENDDTNNLRTYIDSLLKGTEPNASETLFTKAEVEGYQTELRNIQKEMDGLLDGSKQLSPGVDYIARANDLTERANNIRLEVLNKIQDNRNSNRNIPINPPQLLKLISEAYTKIDKVSQLIESVNPGIDLINLNKINSDLTKPLEELDNLVTNAADPPTNAQKNSILDKRKEITTLQRNFSAIYNKFTPPTGQELSRDIKDLPKKITDKINELKTQINEKLNSFSISNIKIESIDNRLKVLKSEANRSRNPITSKTNDKLGNLSVEFDQLITQLKKIKLYTQSEMLEDAHTAALETNLGYINSILQANQDSVSANLFAPIPPE